MEISGLLLERHGISHSTIQLESSHDMKPLDALTACREGTGCVANNR